MKQFTASAVANTRFIHLENYPSKGEQIYINYLSTATYYAEVFLISEFYSFVRVPCACKGLMGYQTTQFHSSKQGETRLHCGRLQLSQFWMDVLQ